MSEDMTRVDSDQDTPEFSKGLIAYSLYLSLMVMSSAMIVLIMSNIHSVMIGPFGIYLMLLAILPAKAVFTSGKGMVVGVLGGVIAIFFDTYMFSWQESLPSMTTLNFYEQILIYLYVIVGAEGCLFLTRKATRTKIRMFG